MKIKTKATLRKKWIKGNLGNGIQFASNFSILPLVVPSCIYSILWFIASSEERNRNFSYRKFWKFKTKQVFWYFDEITETLKIEWNFLIFICSLWQVGWNPMQLFRLLITCLMFRIRFPSMNCLYGSAMKKITEKSLKTNELRRFVIFILTQKCRRLKQSQHHTSGEQFKWGNVFVMNGVGRRLAPCLIINGRHILCMLMFDLKQSSRM